jgi:DNA replication protein DnaC
MSALYQEEIAGCCRQLRLSSILAEYAMTTECDTNQEYLYQVLSRTIAYRRDCRIGKLIGSAGFPKPYDFSQFRADEVEFQTGCSLESLKSLEFMHQGRNIIMYGGTGTGKTMLSICIGIRLCESGIPVRFFRTAALINRLSEQKAAGTLSHFLKKLNKTEVIILDEFGYVPYDRTGSQLLFDYLSEIHEKKLVILNTNLEFSRWVNVLYDEQMTSALIGRLTHHCHLILFPGGNNRLRESSLNETYHEIAAKNRKEE